ncbi:hypothetical protein [Agaribacterium sp. ZY112]|uniref:hypothetical protein n=1 Tax=Agaribacterium sp. ZY112 TaxID=3233574 RepID=UPI0035247E2B
MSHYYHTGMRNVFVGADVATGVFLLCYRGYGLQDRIVASLAGLSAILVAFFPIALEGEFSEAMLLASKIHVAAALLFLLCLAYFCLVLFVRSGEGLELSQKKKRHNLIYRICGINIVMVIIAVITYGEISAVHEYFAATPFIFFLELIAFWSFGLAWLVKGRALGAA